MDASKRFANSDSTTVGSFLVFALKVIVLLLLGGAVLSFFSVRNTDENQIENETLLKLQKVEQACKVYSIVNDGAWPVSLEELIVPSSDGRRPLLEGGPSAITSDWGSPMEMEIQKDADGNERVVITTTDPKGKVLRWPRK